MQDGATEGAHKESAARQFALLGLGKAADQVIAEGPPFPSELSYLWAWYCQHSMGLSVNGMAYPSVTWEGVWSWARLMGVEIEPWEALTMIRLGNIRMNIEAEKINQASKTA